MSKQKNQKEPGAQLVADNLNFAMKKTGKSVKGLAYESNVSYNQLTGYLRAEHVPQKAVMDRLCCALKISPTQLSGSVMSDEPEQVNNDGIELLVINQTISETVLSEFIKDLNEARAYVPTELSARLFRNGRCLLNLPPCPEA